MNKVITTLNILIEGLQKKSEYLEKISNYTKQQKLLLSEEAFNVEVYDHYVDQKQLLITKINTIDVGFKSSYKRIKTYIDVEPKMYSDEILRLQELIKKIGNTDIEIKVLEGNNVNLLKILKNGGIKDVYRAKKSSKTAINSYKMQKSIK